MFQTGFFNNPRFRALTLVDNFSRGCLCSEVDQSIKGEQVADVLNRINIRHGILKMIRLDMALSSSLRWKDVNLFNGIAILKMTKNDDKRSIPLNRIIWDLVKEKSRARYLASYYVFINDAGTKMDGGNFRTDYMKVLNLKRDRVNLFARTISLDGSETKNG